MIGFACALLHICSAALIVRTKVAVLIGSHIPLACLLHLIERFTSVHELFRPIYALRRASFLSLRPSTCRGARPCYPHIVPLPACISFVFSWSL